MGRFWSTLDIFFIVVGAMIIGITAAAGNPGDLHNQQQHCKELNITLRDPSCFSKRQWKSKARVFCQISVDCDSPSQHLMLEQKQRHQEIKALNQPCVSSITTKRRYRGFMMASFQCCCERKRKSTIVTHDNKEIFLYPTHVGDKGKLKIQDGGKYERTKILPPSKNDKSVPKSIAEKPSIHQAQPTGNHQIPIDEIKKIRIIPVAVAHAAADPPQQHRRLKLLTTPKTTIPKQSKIIESKEIMKSRLSTSLPTTDATPLATPKTLKPQKGTQNIKVKIQKQKQKKQQGKCDIEEAINHYRTSIPRRQDQCIYHVSYLEDLGDTEKWHLGSIQSLRSQLREGKKRYLVLKAQNSTLAKMRLNSKLLFVVEFFFMRNI